MVAYDNISYSLGDGIVEVLFDRPDVLNAYDEATLEELNVALEDAMSNDSVYAVIISGKGRAFCAGKDLNVADETENKLGGSERVRKVVTAMGHLYRGPKPTVAAINGVAVGGGMELALSCDLRVMAENAFLRDQHLDVGLTPATAGGLLLPRLIGESKTKEYLLLGRDIRSDAAEDHGLVIEVTETDRALETAWTIARELRDRPALAMEKSKALIDPGQSFAEHTQAVLDARWECLRDPESQEAAAAIREGRESSFDRNY